MCNILNNSIIKKLIVTLLIITLLINIFPNKVQADSFIEHAGGSIISVVLDFLIFLGDTVLEILQNNFISTDDVVIQADSSNCATFSGWDFIKFIVGVIVVVVSIVVAVGSFGTLSGASFAGVMAGIKVLGGTLLFTAGGGLLAVNGASGVIEGLQGKFDLPLIRYTPYEIFSNQIPMLDINFISPMENVEIKEDGEIKFEVEGMDYNIKYTGIKNIEYDYEYANKDKILNDLFTISNEFAKWNTVLTRVVGDDSQKSEAYEQYNAMNDQEKIFWEDAYALFDNAIWNISELKTEIESDNGENTDWINERLNEPIYLVSDVVEYENEDGETISEYIYELNDEGEKVIERLSVKGYINNAFETMDRICDVLENLPENSAIGKDFELTELVIKNVRMTATQEEILVKEYQSSASILQQGISTWYKVLRRVALVGLLSILVYVGIRIIIASTASDKAKYKKMFLNWLVSVCILFVLHYLMVFIITMSTKITEIFLIKEGEPNILVDLPVDTTIGEQNLPRC